jgi:energy-coupling factor transporter ATP-binding protein EcfA2
MNKKTQTKTQPPTTRFEFRWEHFRSFEDTDWIQIKPITVFIGPNNSGKTSLVRPLLLLKQTTESRDPRIALKLGGPLTNLGTYHDIVFQHRTSQSLRLQVRYMLPSSSAPPKPGKLGDDPPCELSVSFRRGSVDSDVRLQQLDIRDIFGRNLLTWREVAPDRYKLKTHTALSGKLGQIIKNSKPEHFLFPDTELLNTIIQRKGRKSTITLRGDNALYIGEMSWTKMKMRELLSSLNYVGPLREYPKRFYEAEEEVPRSVGLRGQNAPQILFLHHDPAFSKAINLWLQRFGLADTITCDRVHPNIFTVMVSGPTGATSVHFADAGFGLSQLLPLIVQGLHATGGVIFYEQPEIHLNPKLQCVLANFFVDIAMNGGKCVVVETHSEHILLRFRSLIAEGALKPEQIALYFVEKKNGRSTARRIPIAPDGRIEPDAWPAGFFEDALGEALKLARLP